MLSGQESSVLARFCELVVPGSAAVDPVSYVERVLAGWSPAEEDRLHAALGLVTRYLDAPDRIADTDGFQLLRTLAVEARYGDPRPEGVVRPEKHLQRVSGEAEVVVVGSGTGGGLIATELARRGHDVLLLEAGGYPAEAARHRVTVPRTDDDEPVALLTGRCAGGTEVAVRAADFDVARFTEETGSTLTSDALRPWYDHVEQRLGERGGPDWTASVHRVNTGFAAMGAVLEPVGSYTAPTLAGDDLRLCTHRAVTAITLDAAAHVTGVQYVNPDGTQGTVRTRTVVLAAGSLGTPQILLRSPDYQALDTPSTRNVGATLGLHPARLVYGLFDEPMDCHQVYPITAHCLTHQRDFVVEGTTIQEPVGFAASMVDKHGLPLWGRDLTEVAGDYRNWAGLLVMANDENTGTVELDPAGKAVFTKGFSKQERRRLDDARTFTTEVLLAAGARRVVWSGLSTSHVQGTARMGTDPARSVVDDRGRAHGVDGLYVGDGSVLPASMSVNPSLTIMALAAMIADNLAGELA